MIIDLFQSTTRPPEYFTLKFETNGAKLEEDNTQVLPALKECNLR